MRLAAVATLGAAGALVTSAALLLAQRQDAFPASPDHPAIQYSVRSPKDRIAQLNLDLHSGATRLTFAAASGYLTSLLSATGVRKESQVLVFSETSAQASQISLVHPRAIYFGDDVAIGWVPGAAQLEIAALDPEQGTIFYTLDQKPGATPQLTRGTGCLTCHRSWDTRAVPGLQVLSTFPMADDKYAYATGVVSDHRTPLDQRWGGWYVTGTAVPSRHFGNRAVVQPANHTAPSAAPALRSVDGQFDVSAYPSPYSDVVALMVLEHQSAMVNLLTWLGWEARLAAADGGASRGRRGAGPAAAGPDRVAEAATALVDYLLFVDEAPISRPVAGSSGFAEWFAAQGPRDRQGRSLRQFDLAHSLFRYRCSYLIYSAAFDALPPTAKDAVYQRMWKILSGSEASGVYAALSRDNRRAIVEILRETKPDLPAYFQAVTR